MAKLVQSPPKYTPEEWHRSNATQYKSTDQERAAAERLRAECERLCVDREIKTQRSQSDVNKKLDQRKTDITFWKSELDRQRDDTVREINAMLESKEKLEKAMSDTDFPLHVAQTCQGFRTGRVGIDLVHDDVEVQLIKEVEVIEGIRALLQRTLEQATEQTRLLRSKKYYLEKDLKDKFTAYSIDEHCSTLNNKSDNISYSPNKAIIDTKSVAPHEWELFSNVNILKAERERAASVTLRGVIDDIVDTTRNDMKRQRQVVNAAFDKRIQEQVEAKETLVDHLAKVNNEIKEMESSIAAVEDAIASKAPPMKVAQTRLETRSQRPNVELVRDPVQFRLIDEVAEITGTLHQLQVQLAQLQSSLKGLNRRQLSLEEDIQIKSNSINIDENQCKNLRQQLPE